MVYGWEEPFVRPRELLVFTPSAFKGVVCHVDNIGSTSQLTLPPSEGKPHRVLFVITRVRGPTKTIFMSNAPPGNTRRKGPSGVALGRRTQSDEISMEEKYHYEIIIFY